MPAVPRSRGAERAEQCNLSLACVGLTYAGQRLDWPLQSRCFEPLATWGRFRVDCQADTSLVVEDCVTVFPAQPLAL